MEKDISLLNSNRYPGIVNTSEMYNFLPCRKHGRPDHFVLQDTANPGTISLASGLITIPGCTDLGRSLVIPWKQLTGKIAQVAGSLPVAGVRRLRCDSSDCPDFPGINLWVRREVTDCTILEQEWHYTLFFENCTDDATPCADRLQALVAKINADPDRPFNATYTAATTGPDVPAYIQLTDIVAGDTLNFIAYEGLENLTVETAPSIGGFTAKDLRDSWGIGCLDAAIPDDRLYSAVIFNYFEKVPMDRDMYGGSNPNANFYSYVEKKKTVIAVFDITVAAANTTQKGVLLGILAGTATPVANYLSHT